MKYIFCGSLALILSLSAANALAMPDTAPRKADPAERFSLMDADKDNSVSWKEFSKARPGFTRKAFDSIDADQNGSITLDEWKTFYAGHGKAGTAPDMGAVMKSMRDCINTPAHDHSAEKAMPLVMPPTEQQKPLINPPVHTDKQQAMPLITPPAAGK